MICQNGLTDAFLDEIDFALNNAATSGKGWKPWYGPGNAYKDWNPMTGIPTKNDQKYVPPRKLTVPLPKPVTGTIPNIIPHVKEIIFSFIKIFPQNFFTSILKTCKVFYHYLFKKPSINT